MGPVGRATTAAAVALVAAAVAVAAGPAAGGHRGGTLRLLSTSDAGSLDPQVNYTFEYWQLYQGVYDGLVAFRKVGGAGSLAVVPDLAVAIPQPSNGGRRWVFRLRKGIRFSNGTTLTPADVVASFRRIFAVKAGTRTTFYGGILGAAACERTPRTCTLAGGVVGDEQAGTVTFNLKAPDPEFLYRLAVPHASILPAETARTALDATPVPGTGAYAFTSYKPGKQLVLERNRYFHEWSHAAQPDGYPDRITYQFGLTADAEVTTIENDQADWMFDPPSTDRLGELATRYAQRLYVHPLWKLWYLPLNTTLPPFDNVKARRALNYAIDRGAVVKLLGGPNAAAPDCQVLPPNFPGRRDYCPYTRNPGASWTAPDLAKAKRLVRESGTAGQPVTVVTSSDELERQLGVYVRSVLADLGYRAKVRTLSGSIQFTYSQNTKNKVQLSVQFWASDYPAASDFIYILLSCESLHRGSSANLNMSVFCNRKLDARMKAALRLAVRDPAAANARWAGIDRAETDAAPIVALVNPKQIDFVSSRVGNFVFSRQWNWLIDQSWVQ